MGTFRLCYWYYKYEVSHIYTTLRDCLTSVMDTNHQFALAFLLLSAVSCLVAEEIDCNRGKFGKLKYKNYYYKYYNMPNQDVPLGVV